MEREEITIEAPFAVAGVTLVPIVKASLHYWHTKGGLSSFGIRQPFSVVIVSPQTTRAFRINGEEVPLDQLSQEVPGLKEMLEGV